MQTKLLDNLLAFVQSHSGFEPAYIQDGAIYCLVSWIHVETLEHGADLECLGASLEEVRASLGY